MNDKLTKKEVCALLRIGYSTLGRWMREARIKFERDTTAGKFESAVFFNRADIQHLIPREPVIPIGFAESVPAPKPVPKPTLTPQDKRTFAEKFRDGDEPDSCGNFCDGANDLYPSSGATLLGPVVPYTTPPVNRDTASHMDPALVGKVGPSGNDSYLNSPEFALARGSISQVQYDSLQATAQKARRMSQQQQKQVVDVNVIRDAFKFGFSR
jgi:hypothetical protein